MFRLISILLLLNAMGVFAQQPLILANSHSWAPLSFSGLDGVPRGLLIEFWGLYSQYSGKKIVFQLDDWNESIEMVRDGRAQVHAGLLKSPKRQKFLLFSDPLFPLVTGLFLREKRVSEYLTIGVVRGSYEAEYVAENRSGWIMVSFNNNKEMIKAAADNEIDGFVADYPTGQYFINNWQLSRKVAFAEFLYSKPIHAAVFVEGEALMANINSGIAQIPEEELNLLLARWEIIPGAKNDGNLLVLWGVTGMLILMLIGWGLRTLKH